MDPLADKRLVLGITGGIAAYKAAELTRLLIRRGARVRVVMTEAACRFVAPATFRALSGEPVLTDLWDEGAGSGMAHIDLTREADAVLVAPASADFMSKLAVGAASDLLSALCLASTCPLLLAPAMNHRMWHNPATQRNAAQLAADGAVLLGPASGEQACGEEGMGRMLEPAALADELAARFRPKSLAGVRVLVTAGPTFETIDPVRAVTNLSSGKMGYAVARACCEAGARVTLVSGPTCLASPPPIELIRVLSAREMAAAVDDRLEETDIFIAVAAVADYRPAHASEQKIKKGEGPLVLELVPNPDILAEAAARPNPPFCVGFAAESENLHQFAERKRRRKKLPLLAANRVQDALGTEESELVLFDDAGAHPLPRGPKIDLARGLIEHVARLYRPAARRN